MNKQKLRDRQTDLALARLLAARLLKHIAGRLEGEDSGKLDLATADFLDTMAERFSCHGANDFHMDEFLPAIRHLIMKDAEAFNGSPQEYDPHASYFTACDYLLMSYCADQLRK